MAEAVKGAALVVRHVCVHYLGIWLSRAHNGNLPRPESGALQRGGKQLQWLAVGPSVSMRLSI